MIPAEAVEAAAKAIFISTGQYGVDWDDLDTYVKDRFRKDGSAALEAAAPHILSDYLLTLAADSKVRGDIGKDGALESWDYLTWKAEQIGPTK